MSAVARVASAVITCITLAACSGVQVVFDPRGPQAREIAQIGWVLIVGAAVIFVAVMALAAYSVRSSSPRHWLARPEFIIGAG